MDKQNDNQIQIQSTKKLAIIITRQNNIKLYLTIIYTVQCNPE